jgi:mRNA-degrading endonuclease toxin of MazEF toxin-antitoxin module
LWGDSPVEVRVLFGAFLRDQLIDVQPRGESGRFMRVDASRVSSGHTELAAVPGNVLLPADTSGLARHSVVNVTQIATIDRAALEDQVGPVPHWLLTQIDEGLKRALALRSS